MKSYTTKPREGVTELKQRKFFSSNVAQDENMYTCLW